MRVLHLDFETFSPLDLKAVGVENYVRHPSFAVTVVGWAFDGEPPRSVVWPNSGLDNEIRLHIASGGTIRAWNAAFEWHVLTYHYNVGPTHEQMDCVMQRALAWGLPGKLETAGPALKLPVVKDATARRLMLTMGRPRKDGLAWHLDRSMKAAAMLASLAAYCQKDVEAERALDHVIPPLHPFERRLSLVDARINERGVLIDVAAAVDLGLAAAHEQGLYNDECTALTGGVVTNPGTQTAKLKWWLESNHVWLQDLSKEQVATVFDPDEEWSIRPSGDVARVLRLRQLAAKSSVAKIAKMVDWASSHDQRARNLLQYYGAGRTGRWAGRGIQVQNLPRVPKGSEPQKVIDICRAEPQGLRLFYPEPMAIISQSLRSCLIARPGHTLVSIDLSQIEARVLAWLAGQADVLEQFASGTDIYVETARRHGSTNRQLGKVLVLACGFGMGAQKFKDTAEKDYGVRLTLAEATAALQAWRRDNTFIVQFWYDLHGAVEAAVKTPGLVVNCGRLMVRTKDGVTQIRKPNGVKLTYHDMRFDKGGGLVFEGLNSITKKWGTERTYGGRLVENVVQSVARDVMAEAVLATPLPVMTVHDEIVWEVREEGNVARLAADMMRQVVESPPAWASGLPIASEIKISRRYGG